LALRNLRVFHAPTLRSLRGSVKWIIPKNLLPFRPFVW
jgi:hypothetical protein